MHRRFTALGRPLLLLTLAPLLLTGCLAGQRGPDPQLTARLDEILGRLSDTGAVYAARVVELPGRRVLYTHDADIPFTPASNMKIPISAAGLDMFGADHTFKTWLVLEDDNLWVVGGGDPGLGDPRLERQRGRTPVSVLDDWADAVLARDMREITGHLYYYDGVLDDEWTHPTWGEDTLHWYGAPIAGLTFNDNCIDITIHPADSGQPARYEIMPPVQDVRIINECLTASEHAPTIEKLPGGNIYKLGGTCAKPDELKSKPVDDPGAFLCDALRIHLAARGVTIRGETRRSTIPPGGALPPPTDKVVALHETAVGDIIGRVNTNSQNLFADVLCKQTGRAWAARQGRHVPGSWADGAQAIRAFLERNRIDHRRFALADGSGLSDDNKVTARLITDIFAVMFDRPDGSIYQDSLAKGGVNGTLEKRFAGYDGKVFAKTGYIEGVRALSGYVHTDSGRWLTFAIIYNQIPGSVAPYEELQDEAVKLLVSWPIRATPAAAHQETSAEAPPVTTP